MRDLIQMSTELCAAPNKISVCYRTYPYKRRTITAVRHSGYTDPMPARKPHGLQIAEQRKVTELMTGIFLRFIFQ